MPSPPFLPSFPHPEILPTSISSSSSSSSHSCRSSCVTGNLPSRNSQTLRHLGGPAVALCSAFRAKKIRGAHIDLAFCLPPATELVTHGYSIAVETAGGGGNCGVGTRKVPPVPGYAATHTRTCLTSARESPHMECRDRPEMLYRVSSRHLSHYLSASGSN